MIIVSEICYNQKNSDLINSGTMITLMCKSSLFKKQIYFEKIQF